MLFLGRVLQVSFDFKLIILINPQSAQCFCETGFLLMRIANKTNQMFPQKPRWLIVTAFSLSLALASCFASSRPTRYVARTQQEAQQAACYKLTQGEVKAIDVASLGVIPGVQTITNEAQKVEIQLIEAKTKFIDAHPQIVSLKQRQAALNTLLQQRLQGACKVLS